jgi:hypothetical protein
VKKHESFRLTTEHIGARVAVDNAYYHRATIEQLFVASKQRIAKLTPDLVTGCAKPITIRRRLGLAKGSVLSGNRSALASKASSPDVYLHVEAAKRTKTSHSLLHEKVDLGRRSRVYHGFPSVRSFALSSPRSGESSMFPTLLTRIIARILRQRRVADKYLRSVEPTAENFSTGVGTNVTSLLTYCRARHKPDADPDPGAPASSRPVPVVPSGAAGNSRIVSRSCASTEVVVSK